MKMSLEKGRIPSSQLTFMLLDFMQGSIYVTSFTFSFTTRDSWLVVILAGIVYIPFALLNIKLSSRFPNDNIIQINDKVFGSVVGKIISVMYCLFFLPACAINLRVQSAFVANIFILDTPFLVFAIFLLLLCVWAAKKGIETIGKVSIMLIPFIIVFLVVYFVLLLNKMDLSRLLPIMDVPPTKFIKSFNTLFSIYMGENFVFFMIMPYIKDRKNIKKHYLIGLAFGVASMLVITLMITLVLGNLAPLAVSPLVKAVRLVEIMNINARIEFVFMGFLITLAFYKCCVLFYVSLLAVSTLVKLRSYKVIIIPVAVIMFSLIMVATATTSNQVEASTNSIPLVIFALFFIMPIITLITAAARKLPGGGEVPPLD